MAGPNDIDTTQIKAVDFQDDWSGGMNLIDSPDKLLVDQAQVIRNFEIRHKNLKKGKGQRPSSRLEIGSFFYDRFSLGDIDSELWGEIDNGAGSSIAIDTGRVKFTGQTSAHAWDLVGLVTKTKSEQGELAYLEFDITTPSSVDSNTRFRIQLSSSSVILASDTGLEIEFDENNNIILREASTETDTTINWAASTTYRIRMEKRSTGWVANIITIPALSSLEPSVVTASQLFSTTFEGHVDNFLTFQVFGGDWFIDDIVFQQEIITGVRTTKNSVFRFYRESATPETLTMANGRVYTQKTSKGYTSLGSGFSRSAKWKASVFLDQAILCNGVDATQVYDGATLKDLGSGITKAPIAKYTIVHQQTPWLTGDPDFPNTLYRADVDDFTSWDVIEPIVDLDAWNGDIITGLIKLGPSLFIIKSSSVWELSGNNNENYELRRVLGAAGSIAPYSIDTNGQVAFWRGVEGIYRFNGVATVLISFIINPIFSPNERSIVPTTVFEKDEDSVGIVHNNKYRCAVVQHGEGDIDENNFEYIFDFLAGAGTGGWFQRSNRNVSMYSAWIGKGDNSELYYATSDTSNMLYQAEVEDGNTRHDHTLVTIENVFDTDFDGRVLSRHFVAPIGRRDYLTKQWNPWHVHYEPVGKKSIGVKFFTSRNFAGELVTIEMTETINPQNLTDGIPMDGTYDMVHGNFQEKASSSLSAVDDKNQSVEIWYEILQSAEVRTKVSYTGTGRRLGIGNFEYAVIRRVAFGFNELNT